MVDVLQTQTGTAEQAAWTIAGPVVSRLPHDHIENLEAQTMATVADPVPMGLWAFATGTWIVGTVFGGAFGPGTTADVAPVLIIFAGLAQFIAGLFAYRRVQALPGTAFCCIGSLYTTMGILLLLDAGHLLPVNATDMILFGFLVESFCFIAFALTVAAWELNIATVLVFGLLAIGYGCVGVPYLANAVGHGGWEIVRNIGGWFMCASAFVAAYLGMALIVNTTFKRDLLPIGGRP
jgi:hypothetical protein